MGTNTAICEQLNKAIDKLPPEILPELASFVEYLQFKASTSVPSVETPVQLKPSSSFLLSIAGLGTANEDDISERDEEILAREIDPVRGWGLKRDDPE